MRIRMPVHMNPYPEPGVHDSKGHPHNQERADHAGEKFGIKRCAELAVAISHRTICENTDVDTHTHTHTHTQMAHMMTDGHDAPKITSRRDRVSHGELIRTRVCSARFAGRRAQEALSELENKEERGTSAIAPCRVKASGLVSTRHPF